MVIAFPYKQIMVACALLLCSFQAEAKSQSLYLTLTHTDTLELKPISSFRSQNYLFARSQFLPEMEDNPYSYYDRINDDHNFAGCQKNGFRYNKANCPAPRILKNKCAIGDGYAECYCAGSENCSGAKYRPSNPYPSSTGASESSCINCSGDKLYSWNCDSSACSAYMIYGSCPSHGNCSRCCDGYYKLNSCASGYEISGSGGSAKCIQSETCFGDTTRNSELGYSCSSCTNKSGQTLYNCSCSGSCSLSACPSHGTCSTDCKGKYCLNSCSSGYSVSGNACIKDCVPNDCSAYPLSSQPANGTYETCSVGCGSGTYKYRLTGCNSGYYLDGEGCTKCDKVNTTCETGKTLVNTCSTDSNVTVGDCVDCRDESSPYNPCYGYYICEGDKEGFGTTCTCGSQTYYEKCLVKETCTYRYRPEESCYGKIWDRSDNRCYWSSGYYIPSTAKSCTALDGNTYYHTAYSCISSGAPCYGFKSTSDCSAAGGFDTTSEKCECGGATYYKQCKDSCTYKYRPEESCYGKIWDRSDNRCYWSSGYYIPSTAKSCTALDGNTYYHTAYSCITSGSPCYGFKSTSDCPGKIVGGETCECGGATFGSVCLTACNYEDTPATCSAKGMSFTLKCSDESGNQFGECS